MYLTGVVVQRVELKPNDGHMYLPIVADIENRPPFSVELPEKYWVKTTMYKTIYVNDDEKFLIWIDSKQPSENDNYGRGFAALYNKKKQVWTDVELKGNAPSIMSYGHWLAGYVMDVRNPARYSPKTNPGKATRDSVSMENPFDFQNPGKYFPGILYLYNTDTQKYIEWETEQGDSEILLVQGEVVYYRVFDEIYKAAIINGEYLGQPELLVKDNRVVPYIHWAFLGNKK